MTKELADQLFYYDEETGKLYWKKPRSNRIKSGSEAGTLCIRGCRQVKFEDKTFKVHRVIWTMKTGSPPSGVIDHIDGDWLNNKFENLRDVSKATNQRNQSRFSTNRSGFNGVSWNKKNQKWTASITIGRVCIYLGRFKNIEEAVLARKIANEKYGFHKNHGREKIIR